MMRIEIINTFIGITPPMDKLLETIIT